MSEKRYGVVGGGLAGLAAADALLRAGKSPILFEQHEQLGGRATTFRDPETGWLLENGQHVWMPCCTALTALIERTGATALTNRQPRLEVTFLEQGRPPATLRASGLPGPLHLLWPLLKFPLLGPADTYTLLRGLASMKRNARDLMRSGSDSRFAVWLLENGQTERTIQVFWDPVVTSVANERVEHVRLDVAAMAVYEAFLAGAGRSNLAMAAASHGEVWDRIAGSLEERGAAVRLGARVEKLDVDLSNGRGAAVVRAVELSDGERIPMDGVVLALPPRAALSLLPDELREMEQFRQGDRLEWSPILNLHVWYRESVTDRGVLCLVNSPLHWIFARPSQEPVGGRHPVPRSAQHLNLVVSASYDFLSRGPDETVPMLLGEVAAHLPVARAVPVLATRIVHERRATFRAVPGSEAHRSSQQTPIRNLALAGAWTDTGWPSTLEGAVRSGEAAVRALGVNSD
jgi:squalene-associated FAD-dependent desaturase